MNNQTVSKSLKTKRLVNRSYRWVSVPKVTADGRKVYSLGKTQKDILDELPKRKTFTRREVREIGASLQLTPFRTDHVFDGIIDRNYVTPLRGKLFRRSSGVKAQ